MPQFHETIYGKRFFDSQLPNLIKQLEIIGNELKWFNDSKGFLQDEVELIDYIKMAVLDELLKND